jgi:IS30 family transposase
MGHLTQEQRYTISQMLQKGYKKVEIARVIGVDKSTITREVKRNADGRNGAYRFDLAHRKAQERKRSKPHAVALTPEVIAYIEQRLREDRWQPEQISGRAKLEGVGCVSTTTIYRYIAADRKAGGTLYKYLRRSKPYRKLKGKYADGRGIIRNRRDISERPPEVDARIRFGDLEVDTVIGANHKGALLTILDRLTGFLWIRKLDGKNAAELAEKTVQALYPWKPWIHTITADNGKEFAEHEKVAKDLEILFFFAKPYHSWERGANENANGLIRQFFPKKMSFESITDEQVMWVEKILNNRPRKRLGFLTPNEKLEKFLFNKKVAFAG